MSVLIETSLGEIVIDLYSNKCPLTCKNFLKLCKIKYYHGCLFQTVQKDFVAQTGDPTGTGCGGDSIYKFLIGEQARFFGDEIHHDLTHSKTGTVAMASGGENLNASQFYIILGDNLNYLDGKHTVFGEIAEGFDTLTRINEAYVDAENRPYQSIRIKHTYILEDPFEDPRKLAKMIPEQEVKDDLRLEDVWVPLDEALGPEELDELIREKAAHSSAVVLESIGDIPEAEVKPPENVLYVCKLNPVTEDEDLHTIFSKFGTVVSAKVIRDAKTGDSFRYAFIEFEKKEACEKAYNCFKMNNAPTIDDRRIHVDFSQSVSKPWPKLRHKGKENGGFKRCAADHQSPEYTVQDENRGGEVYDIVFEGESPKSKKRDHSHEREKIRRRSFQGYGDGKRRRKDERVAEDKADKYNGRRKRPEEVREETQREKRKRQKGR